MTSTGLTAGTLVWITWVRRYLLGLQSKVTLFVSLVKKYLGGDLLRPCNSCFSSNSCPPSLAPTGWSLLQHSLLWSLPSGDFVFKLQLAHMPPSLQLINPYALLRRQLVPAPEHAQCSLPPCRPPPSHHLFTVPQQWDETQRNAFSLPG